MRADDRQVFNRLVEFAGYRAEARFGREEPVGMKKKRTGQGILLLNFVPA
jgi:hypothetical protein